MSFRTAALVQQEKINRDWNQQQQEALSHMYRKYPSLVKGIAIDKMIVELVSRFFGVEPGEMLVTLYDFELAYAENRTEFEKALATLPPQVQKEKVIDEIAQLLSPESFQAERIRLSGMTYEALAKRRDQIKLKQQLKPHTAAEIKEGLKLVRAQQTRDPVLPAEWTKERLMSKETSSHALKFLIRRFGVTAVNNRLLGRA